MSFADGDHLLLAVAVEVAGHEEAAHRVAQRRDREAARRGRAGVVAADLERAAFGRLDRDVELVASRRRRRRRRGSPSRGGSPRSPTTVAALPELRHVAHHLRRPGACRRGGSARSASRTPRARRRRRGRRPRSRARRCPSGGRARSLEAAACLAGARPFDDALVVGRDGDVRLPVPVEVGDLGVAHAAELAAEVRLPDGLRARPARRLVPELQRRGAARHRAAEGQDRRPLAGRRVDHRLVEDGGGRVLEAPSISQRPPRRRRKRSSEWGFGAGARALLEARHRDEQALREVGGSLCGLRRAGRGRRGPRRGLRAPAAGARASSRGPQPAAARSSASPRPAAFVVDPIAIPPGTDGPGSCSSRAAQAPDVVHPRARASSRRAARATSTPRTCAVRELALRPLPRGRPAVRLRGGRRARSSSTPSSSSARPARRSSSSSTTSRCTTGTSRCAPS